MNTHGVRRGARRIQGRLSRRAVILLYHRVADVHDPQLLAVSAERFARQLEHIERHFQPVPLGDLIRRGVPHRGVAITFDDGYLDNLTAAKPLLERVGVPATVFVTTGYLGRELPSDVLDRCLLSPGRVPPSLTLEVDGQIRTWQTGDMVTGETALWDVTCNNSPTDRHRAYRELHALLRPLSAEKREQALKYLRRWAGVSDEPRSDRRALTEAEVRELARGNLVEIGAHGVHHVVLGAQEPTSQRAELENSKHALEEVLGHRVLSFAYPYGGDSDIGSEAPRLARSAGFELACANVPGAVTSRTDHYHLPRMLVRNWDESEFAARLRTAF